MTDLATAPETQALQETNRALRDQIANLQNRITVLQNDHQNFLKVMSQNAYEAAVRHDWCSIARELVEELGGTWPEARYRVTYTRTYTTVYRTDDNDFEEDVDFDGGYASTPSEPANATGELGEVEDLGWQIDNIESLGAVEY